MSDLAGWTWCAECCTYHAEGQHLPVWLVWCEDYDEGIDDAEEVRASDAKIAAERWAERSDCQSAEYSIIAGGDVTVCVVLEERKGLADPVLYRVSGGSVPQYNAVFVGRGEKP